MPIKKNNKTVEYNVKLVYGFLFTSLIILSALVLWMFQPFLIDIIIAGVIASFFYPVYKFVFKGVKSKRIASFITTLLIAAIVFVPIINFAYYLVERSIDAYAQYAPMVQTENFAAQFNETSTDILDAINLSPDQLNTVVTTVAERVNSFLVQASSSLVRGTTSFFVSFLIIFLTIYYLFVDGKKLSRKFMNLTPLPNKYDAQIFNTFREVSYSTIVSTFLVALFQGIVGGIGFLVVGLPAFFPALLMGILSIVPYVGAVLIWVPFDIYLFATGQVWQGFILLMFGMLISNGDNLLRAYLIKGKSKVHELLIFFSLIGGLVIFGFWGIIVGPLLLSLFLTVLNIYENEFADQLEVELEE